MQESGATPTPRGHRTASETPSEGTAPISESDLRQYMRSIDDLSNVVTGQSTPSPEPEGVVGEEKQPRRVNVEAPPSWWHKGMLFWCGASAAIAVVVLGTGALIALRASFFCASLGFCSVEVFDSFSKALASAERTARHLDEATSLMAYEADTAVMEAQLRRLDQDGPLSDAQRVNMQQLWEKARLAQARLTKEQRDQRIVRQVGAELDSRSPSTGYTNRERRMWLRQLQPIAVNSFSHGEAQSLRQRLRPPQPSPLQAPAMPTPAGSGHEDRRSEPRSVRRTAIPSPPPAPADAPPPSPIQKSSNNAPYRAVPLW